MVNGNLRSKKRKNKTLRKRNLRSKRISRKNNLRIKRNNKTLKKRNLRSKRISRKNNLRSKRISRKNKRRSRKYKNKKNNLRNKRISKKVQSGGVFPFILIMALPKILKAIPGATDAWNNFINYLLSELFERTGLKHYFTEEESDETDYISDIEFAAKFSHKIASNLQHLLCGPHGLLVILSKIMCALKNYIGNIFLDLLIKKENIEKFLHIHKEDILKGCIDLLSDVYGSLLPKKFNLESIKVIIEGFAEIIDLESLTAKLEENLSQGGGMDYSMVLNSSLPVQQAQAVLNSSLPVQPGTPSSQEDATAGMDGSVFHPENVEKATKILKTIHGMLEGGDIKKRIIKKIYEILKQIPGEICHLIFDTLLSNFSMGRAEMLHDKKNATLIKEDEMDRDVKNKKISAVLKSKLYTTAMCPIIVNMVKKKGGGVEKEDLKDEDIGWKDGEILDINACKGISMKVFPKEKSEAAAAAVEGFTRTFRDKKTKFKCHEIGWLSVENVGVDHIDYYGGVESLTEREPEFSKHPVVINISTFLQKMGNNPTAHIGETKAMHFSQEFLSQFETDFGKELQESFVAKTMSFLEGHKGVTSRPTSTRVSAHWKTAQAVRVQHAEHDVSVPNPALIRIDSLTGRVCYSSLIEGDNLYHHHNECYCRGWFPFEESRQPRYKLHYMHIVHTLKNPPFNDFLERFIDLQFFTDAASADARDAAAAAASSSSRYDARDAAVAAAVSAADAAAAAQNFRDKYFEVDISNQPFPEFIKLYVRLLSFVKIMCMFIFYHKGWFSGVREEYKVKYLLAFVQKHIGIPIEGHDKSFLSKLILDHDLKDVSNLNFCAKLIGPIITHCSSLDHNVLTQLLENPQEINRLMVWSGHAKNYKMSRVVDKVTSWMEGFSYPGHIVKVDYIKPDGKQRWRYKQVNLSDTSVSSTHACYFQTFTAETSATTDGMLQFNKGDEITIIGQNETSLVGFVSKDNKGFPKTDISVEEIEYSSVPERAKILFLDLGDDTEAIQLNHKSVGNTEVDVIQYPIRKNIIITEEELQTLLLGDGRFASILGSDDMDQSLEVSYSPTGGGGAAAAAAATAAY